MGKRGRIDPALAVVLLRSSDMLPRAGLPIGVLLPGGRKASEFSDPIRPAARLAVYDVRVGLPPICKTWGTAGRQHIASLSPRTRTSAQMVALRGYQVPGRNRAPPAAPRRQ